MRAWLKQPLPPHTSTHLSLVRKSVRRRRFLLCAGNRLLPPLLARTSSLQLRVQRRTQLALALSNQVSNLDAAGG